MSNPAAGVPPNLVRMPRAVPIARFLSADSICCIASPRPPHIDVSMACFNAAQSGHYRGVSSSSSKDNKGGIVHGVDLSQRSARWNRHASMATTGTSESIFE